VIDKAVVKAGFHEKNIEWFAKIQHRYYFTVPTLQNAIYLYERFLKTSAQLDDLLGKFDPVNLVYVFIILSLNLSFKYMESFCFDFDLCASLIDFVEPPTKALIARVEQNMIRGLGWRLHNITPAAQIGNISKALHLDILTCELALHFSNLLLTSRRNILKSPTLLAVASIYFSLDVLEMALPERNLIKEKDLSTLVERLFAFTGLSLPMIQLEIKMIRAILRNQRGSCKKFTEIFLSKSLKSSIQTRRRIQRFLRNFI